MIFHSTAAQRLHHHPYSCLLQQLILQLVFHRFLLACALPVDPTPTIHRHFHQLQSRTFGGSLLSKHGASNRGIHDISRTACCTIRLEVRHLSLNRVLDPVRIISDLVCGKHKEFISKTNLDAFHDSFGKWLFPVLLSCTVSDVVIKFVDGIATEIAMRFTWRTEFDSLFYNTPHKTLFILNYNYTFLLLDFTKSFTITTV